MKKRNADQLRKACQHAAVVSAARRKGFRIVEGPEHYQTQRSRFTLRPVDGFKPPCCGGKCRDRKRKTADKIKSGQVCRYFARIRSGEKRRSPWSEVRRIINSHPAGLRVLSKKVEYRGQDAPLRIKCLRAGHKFTQSYAQLRRRDKRMSTCPNCGRGWGEALALAIVQYLLDVKLLLEYTPHFLKPLKGSKSSLRFDGFTKKRIAGRMLSIAVEHQGEQHYNPDHNFHQRSKNPRESYLRLKKADQHKKSVCVRDRRLIVIRDLRRISSLSRAVNSVVSKVRAAIPEYSVKRLAKRAAALKADDCRELYNRWGMFSRSYVLYRRLSRQAKRKNMTLIAFDPRRRLIKTRCNVNPQHTSKWRPLNGKVSGCRDCHIEAVAGHNRLDEAPVKTRAREAGWSALWKRGSYQNQRQLLPWQCMGCERTVNDSFEHVCVRPCTHCKKRADLYLLTDEAIKARGDTLLTPMARFPTSQRGRVSLRCTRSGGCNTVHTQAIEKILAGKMHGCDKGKRAARTRYRTQRQALRSRGPRYR